MTGLVGKGALLWFVEDRIGQDPKSKHLKNSSSWQFCICYFTFHCKHFRVIYSQEDVSRLTSLLTDLHLVFVQWTILSLSLSLSGVCRHKWKTVWQHCDCFFDWLFVLLTDWESKQLQTDTSVCSHALTDMSSRDGSCIAIHSRRQSSCPKKTKKRKNPQQKFYHVCKCSLR